MLRAPAAGQAQGACFPILRSFWWVGEMGWVRTLLPVPLPRSVASSALGGQPFFVGVRLHVGRGRPRGQCVGAGDGPPLGSRFLLSFPEALSCQDLGL